MEKYVVRCDPTHWIYYTVERKNLIEHKTYIQALPIFDRLRLCFLRWHKNICYSILIRINIKIRSTNNVQHLFVIIFLEFYSYIKSFNGGYYACAWFSAITPFFMGIWRKRKNYDFYERASWCTLTCCIIFDQEVVQEDLTKKHARWYARFFVN